MRKDKYYLFKILSRKTKLFLNHNVNHVDIKSNNMFQIQLVTSV